jgi:hypothetical protein
VIKDNQREFSSWREIHVGGNGCSMRVICAQLLMRLLFTIMLMLMPNGVRAEILSPPTINGSYATGGDATVANGTCTSPNQGGSTSGTNSPATLTGLGALGTSFFDVNARVIRGTASTSKWNEGVCFPSVNTIRFQPTTTPTVANGANGPGYGEYDFDFNASGVKGLSFKVDGLDNGDYLEIFAFDAGAAPVPVTASNTTPGVGLSIYTPFVDRLTGGATDTNGRGFLSVNPSTPSSILVDFTTSTTVKKVRIRFGKSSNLTSNATSLFSQFKWDVETSVQVIKSSTGGTGAFKFNGDNGFGAEETITTLVPGTAVSGTKHIVTNAATATTITETVPVGYKVSSITCVGFAAGTVTPNLAAGSVLLDAAVMAAGNKVVCTFTNEKVATVKVQKISNGGTAAFAFSTPVNLASVPGTITTATAGTAAPATPVAINITTLNTSTSFTETAVAGYAMTAFSCTDANSAVTGNTGTFGSFVSATRVVTIPAANVKAGAALTCQVTNAKTPTVKVQKISSGGTAAFAFSGQTNLAATPASITTATAGVSAPVSPSAINVTAIGTDVTITESSVAGYALVAFTCTDANAAVTGSSGSFGAFVAATRVGTILATNIKAGADITCTFTNAKLPTVTLTKISNGGVGGFTFTGTNGWASQTITTATAGTGVAGAAQTLTAAGAATTITETAVAGYAMTGVTCTGTGGGTQPTVNLSTRTIDFTAAQTAAGSTIACTVTNGVPSLSVVKAQTTAKGSGNVSTRLEVGDVVTYSYNVTNTGNTTLTDINPEDSHNGASALADPSSPSLFTDNAPSGDTVDDNPAADIWGTLGVGDVVRFTSTYVITQADVDLLQ